MTDVIAKLRALHEQADEVPWSWTEPAKTGGRWPRPWFAWYTIDDDGLHGDPDDLDLIVAARNALPALLDAAELLRTIRATELHGSHVTLAAEIDAVLARLEETP